MGLNGSNQIWLRLQLQVEEGGEATDAAKKNGWGGRGWYPCRHEGNRGFAAIKKTKQKTNKKINAGHTFIGKRICPSGGRPSDKRQETPSRNQVKEIHIFNQSLNASETHFPLPQKMAVRMHWTDWRSGSKRKNVAHFWEWSKNAPKCTYGKN